MTSTTSRAFSMGMSADTLQEREPQGIRRTARLLARSVLFVTLLAACVDVVGEVDVERFPILVAPTDPTPCPDGEDCSTCTPADMRCSGDLLQRCNGVGSAFEFVAKCGSAALCDAAGGRCQLAECAPREQRCTESGAREICNRDRTGFELVEQCASLAACSAVSGRERCIDASCSPGRQRCNGRQIEQCLPDGASFAPVGTPCESAALCEEEESGLARCNTPTCQPGAFRCSDRELERCSDELDGFVAVETCASPEHCRATAGQCEPADCEPLSHRCAGAVLERCDATGARFEQVTTCSSAESCDATAGVCLTAPPPPPPPPPVLGNEAYTFRDRTVPRANGLGPLSVTMPDQWNDVDTTPLTNSTGAVRGPRLIASTDRARFTTYYDIPGLYFTAVPRPPSDIAAMLAEFDLSRTCTRGGAVTYRDPLYTGTSRTWTNCGATGATTIVVAAEPADRSFVTVVIVTSLASRDETARRRIWDSFEVD